MMDDCRVEWNGFGYSLMESSSCKAGYEGALQLFLKVSHECFEEICWSQIRVRQGYFFFSFFSVFP